MRSFWWQKRTGTHEPAATPPEPLPAPDPEEDEHLARFRTHVRAAVQAADGERVDFEVPETVGPSALSIFQGPPYAQTFEGMPVRVHHLPGRGGADTLAAYWRTGGVQQEWYRYIPSPNLGLSPEAVEAYHQVRAAGGSIQVAAHGVRRSRQLPPDVREVYHTLLGDGTEPDMAAELAWNVTRGSSRE